MDKLLSDTPHFDNLLLEKTISYAKKIGWQQVPHPNQNIILFQRSTDELDRPVQLILPSSATFWDSSILLDKAIKLLAASEDTSLAAISAAIQSENNSAEPVSVVSNPLREEALLQKVSRLLNLPKRELARVSGYYNVAKTNQARINLADVYDAFAANSLLPIHAKQKNERAQQGIYRVRVDKRGQITISSKYTQIMGLKPGDEFEVKLSSKQILLCHLERTGNKQPINQSDRS
jgi:AbrB-like transcriptional regulator